MINLVSRVGQGEGLFLKRSVPAGTVRDSMTMCILPFLEAPFLFLPFAICVFLFKTFLHFSEGDRLLQWSPPRRPGA